MFTKFDFVIRNCGKLNIEAITNTESSESSKKFQYKSKISTPKRNVKPTPSFASDVSNDIANLKNSLSNCVQ